MIISWPLEQSGPTTWLTTTYQGFPYGNTRPGIVLYIHGRGLRHAAVHRATDSWRAQIIEKWPSPGSSRKKSLGIHWTFRWSGA